MSATWRGNAPMPLPPVGLLGFVRAVLRGVPLLLLLAGGLALLLLLRLPERAMRHPRRPWTSWITVIVCRVALRLLGLRVRRVGEPWRGPGAMVANHSSWLDIFALNAVRPLAFVAKAEVEGWAGIGWLAQATGTLFIRREARGEAAAQANAVGERLRRGEALAFFPEGTSTDGRRVLPFKAPLFAGLLLPDLPEGTSVQPITLAWAAPEGEDPRFYGWFADAAFGPHALRVLAARRPGEVTITLHPPIPVAGRDRKSLARVSEALVRGALL